MKICQTCGAMAADDVCTCLQCGEASWLQGAKDEPAPVVADEPVVRDVQPQPRMQQPQNQSWKRRR